MEQLNLPSYEIKLRRHGERTDILDVLRGRFVSLTPEEWVRQHFVHYLTDHLSYPAPLLANEVEISVGQKRLRCDTILYNKVCAPRMIVEYKAPSVAVTRKVFDQVAAYNTLLHADYQEVSNGLSHYCCHIDYERRAYRFLPSIPHYSALE